MLNHDWMDDIFLFIVFIIIILAVIAIVWLLRQEIKERNSTGKRE